MNAPGISLPVLMGMTVEQALERLCDVKKVKEKLQILSDLGLGYLTLGEATPALSGGEAQRLKLAAEMERHRTTPYLYLTSQRLDFIRWMYGY